MMQEQLFEPILNIVVETMPRDNLLNSACLEFFDFIKREDIKPLIVHLVEHYRDKLTNITYVDTFSHFIDRYDRTQGFAPGMGSSIVDTEEDTPQRPDAGRGDRWDSGVRDLDATEEEYFNTSDDEEDVANKQTEGLTNGAGPKPLVDYPSDEETEAMDAELSVGVLPANGDTPESSASGGTENGIVLTPTSSTGPSPPERLSEKRRREEDDDDELGKLAQQHKRRNSSISVGSNTSSILRRKKSFTNGSNGVTAKPGKIAISLSPAIKTGGEGNGGDDES